MIFPRLEYKPVRRPQYIDPYKDNEEDNETERNNENNENYENNENNETHKTHENHDSGKEQVQPKQDQGESTPLHEFNVANTWAGMNKNKPKQKIGNIFLPKHMPVSCI